LSGCKTNSVDKKEVNEFDTLITEFNTMFGVRSDLQTVVNFMIQSGIKYEPELTLDTAIVKDYINTPQIAAYMCGVYSADALYHSAFGNGDAAFKSYTSAQVLANHIGVGPYYIEHLLKSRKEGLSEKDSLLYKFDVVLAEFDTNIVQQQRFGIIAAYLLGNLIEKLYLVDQGLKSLEGKSVSEISNQGRYLFEFMISEKKSIDLFVGILDRYASDEKSLYHMELSTLQSLYEALYLKGVPNYKTTGIYSSPDEIKDISEQIEKIRSLIVHLY
jgi:hypothetical protein